MKPVLRGFRLVTLNASTTTHSDEEQYLPFEILSAWISGRLGNKIHGFMGMVYNITDGDSIQSPRRVLK
jgi:hypothetical protein